MRRRLIAAVAVVGGIVGGGASPASAYYTWTCPNSYSAQTCWAGTGYLAHRSVLNQLWVQRYEVCAKGRTAAGNTRLGGGNGCNYNTTYRASCFGSTTPTTALYIYWAGSGQPASNIGSAYMAGEFPPNGLCDGV